MNYSTSPRNGHLIIHSKGQTQVGGIRQNETNNYDAAKIITSLSKAPSVFIIDSNNNL